MKKIILSLLLLPSLCFGAAYDFGMSQRSAADNSWVMKLMASPSTPGVMVYDPATKLTVWNTLGSGLSVSAGVINATASVGPAGPKGDTGAVGPQGPKGDTGTQGVAGSAGPKGDVGEQGPQGVPGATGPKGDAGIQGSAGPQGVKGDTGAIGPQGVQGLPGPKGDTGAAGAQGLQGVQGATGPQGPKGDTGAASTVVGPQGPIGLTGAVGPQGVKGDTGSQGPAGPAGATGPQGTKGDTGLQGVQGATGLTGPAGADSTVPGPQGPVGATGAAAPTPAPGAVTRALNTAFQPNATRPVLISYNVDISVVSLLLAGTQGTVTLQYADNAAMTTNLVTVASATNSTGGVLNVANIGTAALVGFIPAGKYVRILTANTAGSPTFTFRNGQETIF